MREIAAEKECAQDRTLLQKQMRREVDDMVDKHENELFCLIEEVRVCIDILH